MARGKHSRALFEVIKQTQEQQRRTANAPRRGTTNWFGWLTRSASPAAGTPTRRRVIEQHAPVMRELPTQPEPTDETDAGEEVASEAQQPIEPPECECVADDGTASTYANDFPHNAEPVLSQTEDTPPDEPPFGVEATQEPSPHDTAITAAIPDDDPAAPHTATPQPQSFNLTLSYPSIALLGLALAMLITVAFLAGRQTSGRLVLTGPSLEQLQQSKPTPEVMNLKNTPPEATVSRGATETAKPPESRKVEQPQPESTANTAAPTPDRRRVGGRNYIIAQSYPDPDNAEKAAALLRKNNIPVTVEQLDAAPGWFCVVTEVGFDRVSSTDCERYQKVIKDLNAQAKAARVKIYEPYLYKWK